MGKKIKKVKMNKTTGGKQTGIEPFPAAFARQRSKMSRITTGHTVIPGNPTQRKFLEFKSLS
jgi:hypothetical protein